MEGTDQPEQIVGQLWVRACVCIEGEKTIASMNAYPIR